MIMAWGDIDIKLQRDLYQKRSEIGTLRQPDLKAQYNNLKNVIDKNSNTPYDRFNFTINSELCSCSAIFQEGAHWKLGEGHHERYFYRIENFDSFQKKNKDFFLNLLDHPDEIHLENDDNKIQDNFNKVVKEFESSGIWVNLSKISEHFFCYRGISWWTNNFDFNSQGAYPNFSLGSDLTQLNSWILEFGFKVGFSTDWFSQNLLFLRLDSTKINKNNIRVPSIIDGFCQPIFSPRNIVDNPVWGMAYDLKKDVTPNYREFVMKSISPDAIDFIPIQINLDTIDNIVSNSRITTNLVDKLIQNI